MSETLDIHDVSLDIADHTAEKSGVLDAAFNEMLRRELYDRPPISTELHDRKVEQMAQGELPERFEQD